MNILPKKRWHVRTKENIARVRKDEAEAYAKEQEKLRKIELAERETRIELLRKRTHDSTTLSTNNSEETVEPILEHVDLFADIEDGRQNLVIPNKNYLKDKKREQEKYEKQIGYLTYLGQDTNEALGVKSWYEIPPKRLGHLKNDTDTIEKDEQTKYFNDPFNVMKKYLPSSYGLLKTLETEEAIDTNVPKEVNFKTHTSKHSKHKKSNKSLHKLKKRKKHKKSKSSSLPSLLNTNTSIDNKSKLEEMRRARLEREAKETKRQNDIILKSKGIIPAYSRPPILEKVYTPCRIINSKKVKQRYNSQFNPEYAKQNLNKE